MRRAFTVEIRQKDQPVATGGNRLGFGGGHIISLLGGDSCQALDDRINPPLQRTATGQIDAHHVPFSIYCMAKSVQTTGRVVLGFVTVNEHHTTRSDAGAKHSFLHDAIPNRAGSTITRPSNHFATRGQPQDLGCPASQRTGYLITFDYGRKQIRIKT